MSFSTTKTDAPIAEPFMKGTGINNPLSPCVVLGGTSILSNHELEVKAKACTIS